MAACHYFVQSQSSRLLRTVLNSKASRASEENFVRMICLRPGQVCEEDEVPQDSDDAEENEDDEVC